MGRRMGNAGHWTRRGSYTQEPTAAQVTEPAQEQAKHANTEGGGDPEAPPLAAEMMGAGLGESLFSLRGMSDGRLLMSQWMTHTQVYMGNTS